MHRKAMVFSAALILVVACLVGAALSSTNDRLAIEQSNAQFYASLNALFTGDVSPMKQIWSHADDVTYMGPAGGFQVGWSDVLATWESQAASKLGGKVEAAEMHTTIGNDLAFVQCFELGNNVDAYGQLQPVSIRATNVFRKENGQWKMIAHHTDLLAFLDKQIPTTQID